MNDDGSLSDLESGCRDLQIELLKKWVLIIAANRAPVTLQTNEAGEIEPSAASERRCNCPRDIVAGIAVFDSAHCLLSHV